MSLSILDIEAYLPKKIINNSNLIKKFTPRASEDLINSLQAIQISQRHTIIDNYENYILGKEERILSEDTNSMLKKTIHKLYSKDQTVFQDIGLFITATDTANRPMPCTAFEIMSEFHGIIPEDVNVLNIQNQGCSVFLKMVDVAKDYLATHPHKYVLLSLAEAHSGFMQAFKDDFYMGIQTMKKERKLTPEEITKYHRVISNFLFGDGAVSILLKQGGAPSFSFDRITHCTNRRVEDKELLTLNQGGIMEPEYEGFPYYAMSPNVPSRGARYAELTLELLKEKSDIFPNNIKDFNEFFIHTGSLKILNGVFTQMGLNPENFQDNISYNVLNTCGNLSACALPMMLYRKIQNKTHPKLSLLISFGVGFSASSAILMHK